MSSLREGLIARPVKNMTRRKPCDLRSSSRDVFVQVRKIYDLIPIIVESTYLKSNRSLNWNQKPT